MDDLQPQNIEKKEGNSLSIPLAIVVAGIIIGGAIFFSNTTPGEVSLKPLENAKKLAVEEISIDPISSADHILGNPEAPVSIIEYSDTECPYCKGFHNTMQQIVNEFGRSGDVAWVYRHFPLAELHPKAPHEAEATECATELGGEPTFWQYTNAIFRVTPSNNGLDEAELPKLAKEVAIDVDAFNKCLSSGKYEEKINAQYESAFKAGGRGTPFSIIVVKTPLTAAQKAAIQNIFASYPADTATISADNTSISVSGAIPYGTMKSILERLLSNS